MEILRNGPGINHCLWDTQAQAASGSPAELAALDAAHQGAGHDEECAPGLHESWKQWAETSAEEYAVRNRGDHEEQETADDGDDTSVGAHAALAAGLAPG